MAAPAPMPSESVSRTSTPAGATAEQAHAVAQITAEPVQPRDDSRFSHLFLRSRHVAEVPPGFEFGVSRRQAASAVGLDARLQMEAQFVVELLCEIAFTPAVA